MNDMRRAVRSVIAETFNVSPEILGDSAVADDVDGWDSLSHTILMIRLQNAFGIRIPESVAANVETVGELVAAVEAIARDGDPTASGQHL
ncbi:acyl carrier protein [Methylobacterium sp. J-068]|uniref:acyl carrier protein n=1 Tax=Methylobacterium sp. J-068 TaxID=2836649 RepID=UPI001FB9E191|nr:acyl carrier protein [Methylobacterium sp. J-068]MCJ2035234.1 acyl carrier protein [Methylobacterium sp. J-068]